MYEKFGQFIDGKWSHSSDKSTYEVINPANEEVIGHASKATKEDVDRALKELIKFNFQIQRQNYSRIQFYLLHILPKEWMKKNLLI